MTRKRRTFRAALEGMVALAAAKGDRPTAYLASECGIRAGQVTAWEKQLMTQFTATAYTSRLIESGVAVSMDGRERPLDNVIVEGLWRTVKYEEV